MSESRSHIDLVNVAHNFIKTLVPQDKWALIQVDSADTFRPASINGRFIPDVQFWDDNLFIIGEAKTIKDFERDHSKQQYQAYLAECKNFHGKAVLVVAVPWQIVRTAKNYFRREREKLGTYFDIYVLNELGGDSKV